MLTLAQVENLALFLTEFMEEKKIIKPSFELMQFMIHMYIESDEKADQEFQAIESEEWYQQRLHD